MRKKSYYIFISVLALGLIVMLIVGFLSSGKAQTHTWRYHSIAKPSNCQEEGITRWVCEICGEFSFRTIPKEAHSIKQESGKDKYYHNGVQHWLHCTKCDQNVYYAEHNYDENGDCIVCGYHYTETLSGINYELINGGKAYSVIGYSGELTSITIPKTYNTLPVTAIKENAFKNSSLTEINFTSVTEIGNYAFMGSKITSCSLLTKVTKIGEGIFKDCVDLVSVSMPQGLTVIPSEMFSGCKSMTEITLPSKLTEIGEYAFSGTALKKFIMPNTVYKLSVGIFKDCENLNYMPLPTPISEIPNYMFYGCKNLKVFELTEGLTKIGDYAFTNSGLVSITIPQGVKYIGYHAFENCKDMIQASFINKHKWYANRGMGDKEFYVKDIYANAEYITKTYVDFYLWPSEKY